MYLFLTRKHVSSLRYRRFIPSSLLSVRPIGENPPALFDLHTFPPYDLCALHTTPTMSTINLASLQYISRESLASEFSSTQSLPQNTAVIDVRDSDHIGGHIAGSTWIPSSQLDYKVPELVRTLKDKDVVVFHCALSQQRGPSAALRYLREKERLDSLGGGVESKGEIKEEGPGKSGEDGKEGRGEAKKQKVYVLKGGFTEWQEKYGEDRTLTEGYQKDIWEFGY